MNFMAKVQAALTEVIHRLWKIFFQTDMHIDHRTSQPLTVKREKRLSDPYYAHQPFPGYAIVRKVVDLSASLLGIELENNVNCTCVLRRNSSVEDQKGRTAVAIR